MATQIEILESLSSEEPYGNSLQIMSLSNQRYWKMIGLLENRIGTSDNNNSISRLLETMSPESRWFVLRSCPVRVYTDKLASLLLSEYLSVSDQKIEQTYNDLQSCFAGISDSNDNDAVNLVSRWTKNGFDLNRRLTEPFPFIVSAWSGTEEFNNIWDEARELEKLFFQQIPSAGAVPCVLRPFSTAQLRRTEAAIEFVGTISKYLLEDIVINVRHICMIDVANWQSTSDSEYREIAQSFSRASMPSCIFLSLHAFSSSLELIESIYHEALHRKLGNLLHVREILDPNYDSNNSPRFKCTWNKNYHWNTNMWQFDRALDAFHIYTHLFIFYGVILELPKHIEEIPRKLAIFYRQQSFDRAMALEKWIRENSKKCMGEYGIEFINLMTGAIEQSKSCLIETSGAKT